MKNEYFPQFRNLSGTPIEHQNLNSTPSTRFANDDDAKVAQTGGYWAPVFLKLGTK
jgi:hypothetical protein